MHSIDVMVKFCFSFKFWHLHHHYSNKHKFKIGYQHHLSFQQTCHSLSLSQLQMKKIIQFIKHLPENCSCWICNTNMTSMHVPHLHDQLNDIGFISSLKYIPSHFMKHSVYFIWPWRRTTIYSLQIL